MILKMKIGSGSRGLLNYISSATKTAHESSRPFFSNMAGQNVKQLSREIGELRKMRPNLKKAVAHLVMSHDPTDRKLTESEWKHAILAALKTHGAEDAAFAAYRHIDTGHDHQHIFF